MAHAYNPGTQWAEARGSEVQSYLWLFHGQHGLHEIVSK